ncbi:hypothetical protein [Mesorhizobium sp.]|uniref:ArnT family glycosyltransferase n=1 Tax=Mesorhizobium sp. TaxID=1871066 RepID=UPI0025DA80E5|nr:hypothetical protein [Mesorhizobium sp.]
MSLAIRISAGLLIASLAAIILSRLGHFSGYLVFALAIAAAMIIRPNGHERSPVISALVLAISFATYAFLYSSEDLDAGRDNGVYSLLAYNIAQHGKVSVAMPQLDDVIARIGVENLGFYPGIYGAASDAHAQFNHLTPALRAAFVDVFGDHELASSNAVLAGIAVFLFAIALWEIIGSGWWVFGTLGLIVNVAFVYVSRSSLTETFAVAAVAMTVLFVSLTLKKPSATNALFASGGLGLLMMSRVDGYLALPFLPLLTFALARHSLENIKITMLAISTTAIFLVWSVVDLRTFSNGYFIALWPIGLKQSVAAGVACLSVSIAIVAIAKLLPTTWHRYSPSVERWGVGLAKAFVPLCAVLAVYALVHSVVADDTRYDMYLAFTLVRAPRELTWYITVPGLFLAIYGAYLLISDRRPDGVVVALPALILIMLFLFYTRITPDHPWGARRWVPYTIPATLMLVTYAFSRFSIKHKLAAQIAALSLAFLYCFQQNAMAKNWWFVPLQSNWRTGYAALAAELTRRNRTFYLSTYSPTASVLTFIYGIPTVPINGKQNDPDVKEETSLPKVCGAFLEQIQGSNNDVEWIGPPNNVVEKCISTTIYSPSDDTPDPDVIPSYRLLAGWNAAEEWGSWTSGTSAGATVHVQSERPSKLIVDGFALVNLKSPNQTVEVYSGEAHLGTILFNVAAPSKKAAIDVPVEFLRGKTDLSLTFRISNPNSPLELGISTDPRTLGFALRSLSLVPDS